MSLLRTLLLPFVRMLLGPQLLPLLPHVLLRVWVCGHTLWSLNQQDRKN